MKILQDFLLGESLFLNLATHKCLAPDFYLHVYFTLKAVTADRKTE